MGAEELKKLVPISVREVEVQKKDIGAGRVTILSDALDIVLRLKTIPDHMKLMLHVVFPECLADELHIAVIVLGEKDLQKLFHDCTAESEKKKVEPTPGSLSAHIRPP